MKKMFRYLLYSVFAAAFIFIFISCEEEEEVLGDIELPPAILVDASESYAVINTAYLRLRERAGDDSRMITTLWRGYVLEVVSRSPAKDIVDNLEDYWYQIRYDGLQGWVFGSYLQLFDNKEEAEIRARAVRAD